MNSEMYTITYRLVNTVIFTVAQVFSLARVIVYPLAIRSSNSRKVISLALVKNDPKLVKGPIPDTAYLAHVTLSSRTPNQWSSTLKANRRYVQWYRWRDLSSMAHRNTASKRRV